MSNDKEQSEFKGFFGWSGRFLIFFLTGGALAASVMSIFKCDFLSFDVSGNDDEALGDYPIDIPEGTDAVNIGLFAYGLDGSKCRGYKDQFFDSDFDMLFAIAKLCAIGAPVFGGLAWVLNFYFCKLKKSIFSVPVTLIFLSLACLGQVGTFLAYAQDGLCFGDGSFGCTLGFQGILSIAAVAGYFFSSVILFFMPKEAKQGRSCCLRKNDGTDDEGEASLDQILGTSEKKRESMMETSRASDDWTFNERNPVWDDPTVANTITYPQVEVTDKANLRGREAENFA